MKGRDSNYLIIYFKNRVTEWVLFTNAFTNPIDYKMRLHLKHFLLSVDTQYIPYTLRIFKLLQ